MNTQEREQLTDFLAQLQAARAGQKDAEADGLIRDAAARQPDAAYLLVQKVFWLEHALQEAQRRAEQLQGECEQLREQLRAAPPSRGAFADANGWGNSLGRAPAPAQQAFPAPVAPAAGGAPSWLGNVATTAAGVVAGSFLFQGIEHLLGHRDGAGLFGGNALATPPNETVVNNFFADAGSAGGSGFEGLTDGLDGLGGDDASWL